MVDLSDSMFFDYPEDLYHALQSYVDAGNTLLDLGDNVLMDSDYEDIPAKAPPVVVGDVISGTEEVLNILQFPEYADMDLGDFLMPNQLDSNSKMDLDILDEFLHPSDLPTVFRIGLVKFEAHSQDKVIVSSLRGSRDAVWSIHELLQVLSYLLSEECLDDMEIMPKTKKKRGRDTHPRSTFTHVFDENLRFKWVVLNKRPYLQIDRYNAEDRDGYPTHRSRINEEAILCLNVADVTYSINQLAKAQRYGMPDLPLEDYAYLLLYQIAGKLQDYETNNYVEAIRQLEKDKQATQELTSTLFFLLSVYCVSRSIANGCLIKSMLGLEKLQHIFQTM